MSSLRSRAAVFKDLIRRLLPRCGWRLLQRINQWRRDAPFRVLERQGWVAVRKDDYYSPLPVKEDLLRNQARWYKPSTLTGLRIDGDGMMCLWQSLHQAYASEYASLPAYDEIGRRGFGVGFTRGDARTLYYMVRHIKPKRYLEIGSGVSTYYCHLARERNRCDGADTEISCIEPRPFPSLQTIPDVNIIQDEVQNVPLRSFELLEAGDVLFIDSSHAAKIDSDVTFLMMEAVPRLASGVYVQIHDVPLPHNFPYPPELYVFPKQWPSYWNEPIVVQAFLEFNDAFDIVLSLPWLNWSKGDLIGPTIPDVSPTFSYENVVASLWIRRIR